MPQPVAHTREHAVRAHLSRLLEKAIVAQRRIAFDDQRGEQHKSYTDVAPARLLNHHGFWSRAASDGKKLKTFAFSQIERLRLEDRQFQPDPAIKQHLREEEGIWFAEEQREVALKVSAETAGNFKRRKLIANQVIMKEVEDGGLIISARIGHTN